MAQDQQLISADQVLKNLLSVIDVTTPDSGMLRGRLVLWFRMGQTDSNRGYSLAVAGNSYDEASLNAIWDVLNQARQVLGLPTNDTSRAGAVLVHSVPKESPPA